MLCKMRSCEVSGAWRVLASFGSESADEEEGWLGAEPCLVWVHETWPRNFAERKILLIEASPKCDFRFRKVYPKG